MQSDDTKTRGCRRALVALLILSGCAGPSITSPRVEALTSLKGRVATMRSLVAVRDFDAASETVTQLRAEVERLRRAGKLTQADSQRILDAATDVVTHLRRVARQFETPSPDQEDSGKSKKGDKERHDGEDD